MSCQPAGILRNGKRRKSLKADKMWQILFRYSWHSKKKKKKDCPLPSDHPNWFQWVTIAVDKFYAHDPNSKSAPVPYVFCILDTTLLTWKGCQTSKLSL